MSYTYKVLKNDIIEYFSNDITHYRSLVGKWSIESLMRDTYYDNIFSYKRTKNWLKNHPEEII